MFMRGGGGMAAGVVVAAILLYAGIFLANLISPFPEGMAAQGAGAFARYLSEAPLPALLVILAGWFVASYGGAFVAAKIGGRGPAWATGALVFLLAVVNFLRVAQPLWLGLSEILAVLVATLLASSA